jgi:hypothetical protein
VTFARYTLINCRKQFPNTSPKLLKDILCVCLREGAITGGLWEGVYVGVVVVVVMMTMMMMMIIIIMLIIIIVIMLPTPLAPKII